MRRIQIYLDRQVLMTVTLYPIKSKVNSHLKITELFQFQTCQWLLLTATTVQVSSFTSNSLHIASWTGLDTSYDMKGFANGINYYMNFQSVKKDSFQLAYSSVWQNKRRRCTVYFKLGKLLRWVSADKILPNLKYATLSFFPTILWIG